MFYSTLLVAATVFTGLASAQWNPSNPVINPASINQTVAQSWCQAERNSCSDLCIGQVAQPNGNTCDPPTLQYNCTCLQGNTPNISDFAQTLPSLQCEEWIRQCVLAHPNDLDGITYCRSVVCGQRNATAYRAQASASSSTSRSASASSTGGSSSATSGASGSSTASSGSASASATARSAAMAMSFAKNYGTGALAAAMLGLFGLAL